MVDVGVGLAVLGIGAPIAAGILKWAPQTNGRGGNSNVPEKLCNARYGALLQDVAEVKDGINELRQDVKSLLKKK